jgi:hypothetical protein
MFQPTFPGPDIFKTTYIPIRLSQNPFETALSYVNHRMLQLEFIKFPISFLRIIQSILI